MCFFFEGDEKMDGSQVGKNFMKHLIFLIILVILVSYGTLVSKLYCDDLVCAFEELFYLMMRLFGALVVIVICMAQVYKDNLECDIF